MNDLGTALTTALHLVAEADPAVLRIVGLSLRVSLAATFCAALIGLPLGALLAVARFSGPARGHRRPECAARLCVGDRDRACWSTCFSRAPVPWASFGILFTPKAMVVAQTLLVLPIVAALARQFAGGIPGREYSRAAQLPRRLRPACRADAALGPALLVAHRGPGGIRAREPRRWAP